MIQTSTCVDCGEPIYTTEFSASLGIHASRCNLCQCRFLAAFTAIALGVIFVLSWPGQPWAWFVALLFAIMGGFWIARCYRLHHKDIPRKIVSRGATTLFLLTCAYGLFSLGMTQHEANQLVFAACVIGSIALVAWSALVCVYGLRLKKRL